MKQAGMLFCALLLGAAAPVLAEAEQGSPVPSSPSQESFWDGIADAFESIFSSSEDEKKDKELPVEKMVEQTDEQKPIQAKRMDRKSEPTDETKKPEPYKVYTAPPVADDPPAYFSGAALDAGRGAFSGWRADAAPTIDLNRPPPLSEAARLRLEGSAAPASLASPPAPRNVPPVSALPKQFFPVFSWGADAKARAQLLPVASSLSLDGDHASVERAIIYIHDVTRAAAEGVATLMTLGGSDGERTLILAPQFPLDVDVLRFAAHLPDDGRFVARWPVEKGWVEGGLSIAAAEQRGVSSFMAVDLLALFLADRRRFPMMRDIVLAGHGAGADFVLRYAALGQAPEILGIDGVRMRFVAANPSSYLYFTGRRLAKTESVVVIPSEESCETVNTYPYGLLDLPPYARRTGISAIRLRYPQRRVFYMVGDKTASDTLLDRSCAAQAQGDTRTTRAYAYRRHIAQSFGDEAAGQTFSFVHNAGYDSVALFGSSCGLAALFGDGVCR